MVKIIIVAACAVALIIVFASLKAAGDERQRRQDLRYYRSVVGQSYEKALGQCRFCTHSRDCKTYCSRCLWQPDGLGVDNLWEEMQR